MTSLAIRYLKREVEPPPKPTVAATRDELQQFAGYYRDTSPRNAILAGVQFLRDGRTIAVEGDRLVLTPDFGPSTPLVPVNPGLFRREREIDASLAFTTTGDGTRILTGPGIYAHAGAAMADRVAACRAAAWQRWSACWRRWWPWAGGSSDGAGDEGRGAFAGLGPIWLAAAATVSAIYWVARDAGPIELGGVSWQSATVFAGTLAYPAS